MIMIKSENVILDKCTSHFKPARRPSQGLTGTCSWAAGKVNFKPRQMGHHCMENPPPLIGKAPFKHFKVLISTENSHGTFMC